MANLLEPYEAIKAQILSTCPDITYCSMWNNQVKAYRDRPGATQWIPSFPAVFIEFQNPEKILQLGNGCQIYQPLFVKLHVVQTFFNATNGTDFMEENPGVFNLLEELFLGLQGFEPQGCVAFFRVSESADYSHDDLYHTVQVWQTNFVDTAANRPIGGTTWDPTSPPGQLDIVITPYPDNLLLTEVDGAILTESEAGEGYIMQPGVPDTFQVTSYCLGTGTTYITNGGGDSWTVGWQLRPDTLQTSDATGVVSTDITVSFSNQSGLTQLCQASGLTSDGSFSTSGNGEGVYFVQQVYNTGLGLGFSTSQLYYVDGSSEEVQAFSNSNGALSLGAEGLDVTVEAALSQNPALTNSGYTWLLQLSDNTLPEVGLGPVETLSLPAPVLGGPTIVKAVTGGISVPPIIQQFFTHSNFNSFSLALGVVS